MILTIAALAIGSKKQQFLRCSAVGVVALCISCSPPASPKPLADDTVAVVEGQTISLRSFMENLTRRGVAGNLPMGRETLLAEMVGSEAAFAKARSAGFDQRPDVQAEIKRLVVARFREEQLTNRTEALPKEEQIQAYYEANPTRFSTPELVRGAVIYLALSAKAVDEKKFELRAQAETIRAEAIRNTASDPAFGLLAQRYSEDQTTRYRGGDLGFLNQTELEQRLEPAAAKALLALERLGEVSPVVAGAEGLYVLKLVARQPASRRPLVEVKDGIAYLLQKAGEAEAEREFYAACTNGLKIRINRSALEKITLQPQFAGPPTIPGMKAPINETRTP